MSLPKTWMVLFPTMFPATLEKAGPKHSTSVPSSSEVAVPLSVDENEVAFVPNPAPVVAEKTRPAPHVDVAPAVLCARVHSLVPPTLQIVTPLEFPVTVQVKLIIPPGQVGGAPVNCPAT